MTDLSRIRAIVTAWRNDTELSAARAMYEIAGVLGIEPPRPVGGKNRSTARMDTREHLSEKMHATDLTRD